MPLLYSKRIFENLEVSKILAKVQHPYVKFIGKQDGVVAKAVRPTVLELSLNFVQEGHLMQQKWCEKNFEDGFEFSDHENLHNRCFH